MKVPILTPLSVLVKICQNPHVIFKPQISFSSNFALCNEKKLLCTFLGQKLYTLQKRDQSKCTFLGFLSARIRFHQILVILKPQLGFSSSFTSLFRLITHNSSVLFQLKFFISSTREVYLKYKFGEMKSLIFGILMGSFYQNNIKFLVQQYRRVISHDTVK